MQVKKNHLNVFILNKQFSQIINQLIGRLAKIKENIEDCAAQMQEDLKRDNQLGNIAYSTELANCIENVEVPIVRTYIIFATNILENLKKMTEKQMSKLT